MNMYRLLFFIYFLSFDQVQTHSLEVDINANKSHTEPPKNKTHQTTQCGNSTKLANVPTPSTRVKKLYLVLAVAGILSVIVSAIYNFIWKPKEVYEYTPVPETDFIVMSPQADLSNSKSKNSKINNII